MAMPATPEDLARIRERLEAILVPCEDRLEWATIYNLPTLRRPGASAHDWFAFVKPATKHVGFYLLPMHHFPELREGLSPALRRRLTGASAFTFPVFDEALFAELEVVVARALERYLASAG